MTVTDFFVLDKMAGSFDECGCCAQGAYQGSFDDFIALKEMLLPCWWWRGGSCRVSDDACVSPEGAASVMADGSEWSQFTDVDMRPPGKPSRAGLLSVLIAYRETQKDKTNE